MSQPGNYQYQMPNPNGSSKSGIPPVVNGQPGAMQFTQNGIQPLSFNSAGTPSSQSSRDPSRETSRDPSPTQYLHNQYRPQLTRPPMPPINGQPSPLSRVSLSQASSGSTQSSQSSPQASPQNPGVHQVPVSTTAAFSPPVKSLAVAAQSSSDSPIGIATQKSAPTIVRDQSSASESAPGKLAFQSTVDSQGRPSGLPQIGGQHMPPTSLPHSQSQSSNVQASWGKGSPIVTNPPPDPTRPTGAWRNPHAEPYSNNAPTNFQHPQTTHSQVTAHSWSQSAPPVPHSNNHSPSTLVSNQTWNNPNAEPNSNDSQGTPQSYALHPGAAPPRTQSQQPGGSVPPPSTTYAQSLANKPSPVNAANVRDPRIGSQGSPTMTTANASMHSVFGNSPFTQKAATAHQNAPSQAQLSLPKPSQYPTPEHQPNRSVLGVNPVSHSSPYGSQQNVASQWKYPQAGYPGHTPTGSPRVPGPQYGAATNVPGGPGPGGQIRQPPTNIGGPPTSGAPTTSFGAPPTSIGAPPTSMGAPPTSIGAPPTSMGAPPTSIGAPPTSIGVPPTSTGAPPTSIGAPPTSMGAPPTSTRAPPTSTGAPPTSVGVAPTSMRVAPTSIGAPPTSMGVAPTSMGVAPTSIGAPPTSIGASPTFIGVQPTSIRGPPTSIGAPRTSIGPPPTSIGAPPRPGQHPEGPYDYRSPQYFGQMSNVPLDNMNKRYPTGPAYPDQTNQLNTQMGNLNVTQSGFNELWGQQSIDLLQCRNILPPEKVEPPRIKLHQEFLDSVNCSPEIFRCTLTKIPESNSLLQKCRLPFGVLIHPFKDLNHLPVIQCSTIVRCRACRTYINPFVYFVDSKRWKCNLCYRVNELPEEFQFDPVTKSYGDPSRRPEVKTSTIEFIAPSEYMLRPPQPAVYLFVLDVSRLAVDSGYLGVVCETIADELTKLPGDGRTQVGFMAIDSAVHFFSMPENVSQPHELIMLDVDDVFLPCPDNLIVNLKEREELVRDLLEQLPQKFHGTYDTNSALGAGLQAAFKLMSPTGGRVTVFQTCLPNLGPGALQPREDPNARASKDVPHLNPATDFYKRLALDYSGQQIAVDLFLLNSQYSDLATLSGMCKFSGGCIYHMPLFRCNKPQHGETLEKMLRRYLARKIGFEAVMRIRCTRGLSIHTFHGNFFVRSTDLLSLPNVNPDAGFGMQVSIEENLSDVQSVCFQAALLYTSSKGERRIRVHTLCLPVSSSMTDILYSADQQAIVGLLSKMAVDRSQQSSLSDARDALINVAIDVFSAYKLSQSSSTGGLMAPGNLKLLPLYIIALVKSVSFRSGTTTRLDDRVYAMCQMKTLPLGQLIQSVYPDLYPVHALDDRNSKDIEGRICPQAPRLHLSAEKLDFRGVFLMDAGDRIYVYVGKSVDPMFCSNVLGVSTYAAIPEELYDLPELDTVESERLRNFVFSLQEEKPYYAPLQIIRDDSHFRTLFTERLIEDRVENALSYYEFLQHLKTQVK